MKHNNRRGFTIIELVSVIIILLLLTALISPNLIKMTKKRKQDVYDNKVKFIESAAVSWGERHLESLNKNDCTCVSIASLISGGFITGDDKNKNNVTDPRTGESMNSLDICVSYDIEIDKVFAQMKDELITCSSNY